MDCQTAVREFQESMEELKSELERLTHNIQDVTKYQAQVFQVTKVLCSWMENIEALAKQRTQVTPFRDPRK